MEARDWISFCMPVVQETVQSILILTSRRLICLHILCWRLFFCLLFIQNMLQGLIRSSCNYNVSCQNELLKESRPQILPTTIHKSLQNGRGVAYYSY